MCIGIFTIKNIQEDEELTLDYKFTLDETIYQKCLCGSEKCRGFLGVKNEKNKNISMDCGYCKETCKSSQKIDVCAVCDTVFHAGAV